MSTFAIDQNLDSFELGQPVELSVSEIESVSGGIIPLVALFAYGFTTGAVAMAAGIWLGTGKTLIVK